LKVRAFRENSDAFGGNAVSGQDAVIGHAEIFEEAPSNVKLGEGWMVSRFEGYFQTWKIELYLIGCIACRMVCFESAATTKDGHQARTESEALCPDEGGKRVPRVRQTRQARLEGTQ
jgi:hypothetical protein